MRKLLIWVEDWLIDWLACCFVFVGAFCVLRFLLHLDPGVILARINMQDDDTAAATGAGGVGGEAAASTQTAFNQVRFTKLGQGKRICSQRRRRRSVETL